MSRTLPGSWFGSVEHHLGNLAATLGRRDEMRERFAAAERTYRSLGAQPWLERLREDQAAPLVSGPRA